MSNLATTTSPAAQTAQCTPAARGIFVANLVAQCAIMVTGAIVRLTSSGLGCPTWPQCVEGSYTPTARQEEAWHKYVEFGNRLLTFALVILAIAAVVAAIMDSRRRRSAGLTRRPTLLLLSLIPIVGTFAQAILGGVTVLTGLSPLSVSSHFIVSILIAAGCVALVVRSRDFGDQPINFLVRPKLRVLTWVMVVTAFFVVILGVLVTGSGPHSGDAKSESRFGFDPRTVAWLHADVVLLFVGLILAMLLAVRLTKGPKQLSRLTLILLTISVIQGVIGYTQYFAGLPVALVTLHVLGASLVWVTVLFMPAATRTRGLAQTID
ncbi:MAG: heme A synthase [Candidatus Nanopelagicales bacterium]|nr:heme A synthase [Candidatus Nanopelagicales bacterium]